ncbi:hypothetical protein [Chitinophaga filiformis]|uniref:Uncharacterized protein n=1 Tax=Chitinophaga filiformis TaxID=104663 RepID=A0ABY4HV64_CHIFI|nr:hypothetical protein [Chitinophaga filiformis]UPK67687.1 hypothetical protein MYF79_22320 [Chitinophaga filiformis]
MHVRFIITVCLLVWRTAAMAQDLSSIPGVPQNALMFVDSVESKKGMEGLDPSKIALIDIVKGAKLKEKYGPRGENGVIFIETVDFARKRYTRMFSDISQSYAKMLQQYGSDSSFQYVLDGSQINSSIPQMLAALERKNIEDIVVLPPKTAKDLVKDYEPNDKLLWVLIKSKTSR